MLQAIGEAGLQQAAAGIVRSIDKASPPRARPDLSALARVGETRDPRRCCWRSANGSTPWPGRARLQFRRAPASPPSLPCSLSSLPQVASSAADLAFTVTELAERLNERRTELETRRASGLPRRAARWPPPPTVSWPALIPQPAPGGLPAGRGPVGRDWPRPRWRALTASARLLSSAAARAASPPARPPGAALSPSGPRPRSVPPGLPPSIDFQRVEAAGGRNHGSNPVRVVNYASHVRASLPPREGRAVGVQEREDETRAPSRTSTCRKLTGLERDQRCPVDAAVAELELGGPLRSAGHRQRVTARAWQAAATAMLASKEHDGAKKRLGGVQTSRPGRSTCRGFLRAGASGGQRQQVVAGGQPPGGHVGEGEQRRPSGIVRPTGAAPPDLPAFDGVDHRFQSGTWRRNQDGIAFQLQHDLVRSPGDLHRGGPFPTTQEDRRKGEDDGLVAAGPPRGVNGAGVAGDSTGAADEGEGPETATDVEIDGGSRRERDHAPRIPSRSAAAIPSGTSHRVGLGAIPPSLDVAGGRDPPERAGRGHTLAEGAEAR